MRILTATLSKVALLLLLLLPSSMKAAAVGEWTYYLSYHDATHCIPVGSSIYALYTGNLLIYDTEDGSVTTLTKLDGLSEKHIALMQDCPAAQKTVLVYSNGNIDLLHRDGTIENMPQYKNKYSGTDLNDLTIVGHEAFLATSEGLVHLNVKHAEITGFYALKVPVISATKCGNLLFAATGKGVYRCDVTENPLDLATWNVCSTLSARQVVALGNHLYLNTAKNGVYHFDVQTATATPVIKTPQTAYFVDREGIVFFNATSYTAISAQTPTVPSRTVTLQGTTNSLCRLQDGTLWVAQGFEGLHAYKETDGKLQVVSSSIGNMGPKRDLCYFLR